MASTLAAVRAVIPQTARLDNGSRANLVSALAQLPRADFDRVTRSLLHDTFVTLDGNLRDDAFNFVDRLDRQGALSRLGGVLDTLSAAPAGAQSQLGDFDIAAFRAAIGVAIANRGSGASQQAVGDALAALPKTVFDRLANTVTDNEYWGTSMSEVAFLFVDEAVRNGKLPELAAEVEKLVPR